MSANIDVSQVSHVDVCMSVTEAMRTLSKDIMLLNGCDSKYAHV